MGQEEEEWIRTGPGTGRNTGQGTEEGIWDMGQREAYHSRFAGHDAVEYIKHTLLVVIGCTQPREHLPSRLTCEPTTSHQCNHTHMLNNNS